MWQANYSGLAPKITVKENFILEGKVSMWFVSCPYARSSADPQLVLKRFEQVGCLAARSVDFGGVEPNDRWRNVSARGIVPREGPLM